MAETQTQTRRAEGTAIIRNEPVQARSAARLTALLDAAAQVIDEIGYERLTTAMVAERAGASIGTVYRYFPDRIAVLQSLAARHTERLMRPVLDEFGSERHEDWRSALSAGMDLLITAFREEPGFASLRGGDVLDLRPATGTPSTKVFADQAFDVLTSRFGLDSGDEARSAFEAAVVISDALGARAFSRDADGDEVFFRHAGLAVFALMEPHWG